MPTISGGSASVVASTLAGFEIGYDEITAGVNIAGTSAAAPTTMITCAAHTFDGAAVLLTVFSPSVTFGSSANNFVTVTLWESGAQIGVLWQGSSPTAAAGMILGMAMNYRFTPSAGSHSYLIRAFTASTTGTPNFGAGSGGAGSGSFLPAFARFTKA